MKLIVNADDFGWDQSCSEAILETFRRRFISTTTACANGEYLEEAIGTVLDTEYAEKVGVHLVLTEGKPLTDKMRGCSTFCKDGLYHFGFSRYKKLSNTDAKIVYDEFSEQIRRLKALGINIHHLDSHHHIHNAPNIFPIVLHVAKEQEINRIRSFRNMGNIPFVKRMGKYAYNWKLQREGMRYSQWFGEKSDYFSCPPQCASSDIVEIMVHPDFDKKGTLIDRSADSSYEDPVGDKLSDLLEVMNERGDSLLSW